MPCLAQKYPFMMGLFAWKCCRLFRQVVGSICFLLNHRDVAMQSYCSSFIESFEVALILWYNTILHGSYGFLDEAMHAFCSKGTIKVAVAAAAAFLSIILKSSSCKTGLLLGFLLPDKIIIICQIAFLAVFMIWEGMDLQNRILLSALNTPFHRKASFYFSGPEPDFRWHNAGLNWWRHLAGRLGLWAYSTCCFGKVCSHRLPETLVVSALWRSLIQQRRMENSEPLWVTCPGAALLF